MLKSMAVVAGACALVAGVAVTGNAAGTSAPAPQQAPARPQAQVESADAVVAELAADEADPSTGIAAARRQKLCARVPNAVIRTQNLEKRLAGSASTKGSLAWLQAKVAAAEAANRTELATVLKNRLAFRTELAEFLPQRLALLQKAQSTVCAAAANPSATS